MVRKDRTPDKTDRNSKQGAPTMNEADKRAIRKEYETDLKKEVALFKIRQRELNARQKNDVTAMYKKHKEEDKALAEEHRLTMLEIRNAREEEIEELD
jgi:hypothetical protein